jgi:deoxyadenosine/deoxycytidine kinase
MKLNRTEICGNIASGKTTLGRLLGRDSFVSIYEKFTENPFYQAFYQDPVGNSFETELTFHLQHYHAIKTNQLPQDIPFTCDFSLTLDQAYADVTLRGRRAELFSQVSDELIEEVGLPSKVIYLNCPERVLLERIRARNREPEKAITIEYLEALRKAIDKRIIETEKRTKVIRIDSNELDFATNPHDQKKILSILSF